MLLLSRPPRQFLPAGHIVESFFFWFLLVISFVSSDVTERTLVSEGTLASGVGLGLGVFPSVIVDLQQTEAGSPASSRIETGSFATVEIIRVQGNVATVVFGDGGSVDVRVGGTVIITGSSSPSLDGHHIVSVVSSSTVFSFVASAAAPGSFLGGRVSIVPSRTDCPAGYYCNGAAKYLCGASIYYCPPNTKRRLQVFRGSNHVGAHYTAGGTSDLNRDEQVLCPVGHYCVDGRSHACPAGRYGSRYGENDPMCEGPCAAGFYCPAGSYRSNQIPCSMGADLHVDPFCPVGSSTPSYAKDGFYTFDTVKINVVDRHDAGGWLDEHQYNDAPREILANTRTTECEPGYFCKNGVRKMCRPGFYGKRYGATTDTCTGQCPGGYYCPIGTVTPIKCGSPHVFCPIQSEAPRVVHPGYYSFSHYDNPSNDTHSDEHQCELGTYCVDGVRHRCAAGRYGATWGLAESNCSGLCAPGYYCPLQSHIRTQIECGGVHLYCPMGSPFPLQADVGYFTASTDVPTLRHDDTSTRRWEDYGGELLFPALRNSSQNKYRSRKFVVVEEADPTHRTRYRQILCPFGNYCVLGRRALCPAGTYGDIQGLSTPACVSPSPAGYFAPPGTTNATQYPCSDPGYYCPLQSGSPTPVPPGWYSFAPESWLRTTKTECHQGNTNATGTEVCTVYAHNAMYYRLHSDAGFEDRRTTMLLCRPGFFCPGVAGDGHMWEMPPGRVSISSGTASYDGAGTLNCTAGYYCEAGSYSPTSRRCGSSVIAPLIHEVQVISTISSWRGPARRSLGVSGSFEISLDTIERSDLLSVQWNQQKTTTLRCEVPCHRRMIQGRENPPRAIAHDATAREMKYSLEMLPNIGTVNVTRSVLSEIDHTFAWSITFVDVVGDVPLLEAETMWTTTSEDDSSTTTRRTNAITLDAHGRQSSHDHVHFEIEPLHGATVSVVEQTKGVATVEKVGVNSDVFCPTGSGNPTPVDVGFYTNLRNNIYTQVVHPTVKGNGIQEPSRGRSGMNDEMAYEQVQCEVGHWCSEGLRDACPRGRYGLIRGLENEFCSGPCAPGFICPHGSYLSTQLDCGYNVEHPTSVYCPPGLDTAAWQPTTVSTGYYTEGGENIHNRTRWFQTICPLGHYCELGKRIRCPAGKYGGATGLSTSECSGNCDAGYFCPQGSWMAHQNKCGSDYGVRSPCKVQQRDGETMLTSRTGERRCEDDHNPTRDTIHSQGTGHWSIHHHETEDYTMVQPRQYHYHTTLFHTSRERRSGDPSSVFCPAGTSVPFQVDAGWYTVGGIETKWSIRLSTPLIATQAQYVAVTQTSDSATGTLAVALTGAAVDEITIFCDVAKTFDTTADIVVGSNVWTMTINTATVTANAGDAITQDNGFMTWTMTLNTPLTATELVGVAVTQTSQSGVGTLAAAMTGVAVNEIKITTAIGQTFDTAAALLIGSGSTTALQSHLSGATSVTTPHAAGTLKTVMSGLTNTIVINAAFGVMFDANTPLVLVGTRTVSVGIHTVSSGDVLIATHTSSAARIPLAHLSTATSVASNRTRVISEKCPTGHFCEEGKIYRCPPGRYGSTRGLTSEFCTGFCPAGTHCPWNTSTPIKCNVNQYSQAGSMTCTDCPQRPGWSLRESTCRTSRACCLK